MKIKINFLPHLSQVLGTEFKLTATRPIKNSLRFDVRSQRMKIKINFLPHLSPRLGPRFHAIGNKTNKKQLEV
jgi:hypothetical protein